MNKLIGFIKLCIGSLLDVIFPGAGSCSACGRLLKQYNQIMLCPDCMQELERLPGDFLKWEQFAASCAYSTCKDIGFDSIGAPYKYDGAARAMVKALKYKGRASAARTMAFLISRELKSREIQYDMIASVPVHEERRKQRGYDQAELIAKELSKITGTPASRVLLKHRNTPSQVTLDEGKRWKNVSAAFRLEGSVKGRSILLIDDVVTTGATMYFCSLQLKSGGAVRVNSMAFAMVLQDEIK